MLISPHDGLATLAKSPQPFTTLFSHGSLEIEIYKPERIDLQSPHSRDEIYVIIKGTGIFDLAGDKKSFAPGDVLFVPAGAAHRFEDFTEDFCTWVFFYGPEGGEASDP